jgi:radical SAM superfamily enzyme YgiQ (UPF0313 family)
MTPKNPSQTETFLYTPCPPQGDAIRMGLMYPYTYPVSMSSLGYLTLFRQLDERPDVAIKRITTDDMQHQPINDLELAGFSFSFELDILEVIRMLDFYQVPLYASAREDEVPLIFAGGPVVMTNPEPYADFFDFFLIGEGEELLTNLIAEYQKLRHIPDRRERLKTLALNVPGVYVPSLYEVDYASDGKISGIHPQIEGMPFPVEKQYIANLDTVIASSPILTENTVFSNTFIVEVMRGCAHRCRFCLASYSMLPARGPSLERIIERIDLGLKYTNKIGLLGALIADHPDFDSICDYLKGIDGIQVSAASLRADTLTPHIAETFKHGGQHNITIAVESGSEKIRKRINKHLKTEAILNAASVTAQAGIPGLKVYGMAGLPDEDWTDLEDTVNLMKQMKKENPRLKLHLGCSTFVPKAATPFQWMDREDTKTLQEKQEFLRKSLVKTCDFRPSSPKWDMIQALFSRGDRRLSGFIVEFARQGANLGALNRTLKQLKQSPHSVDLPPLDWYALRRREPDEILPWDVLSLGVSKETLYKESGLEKAAPLATVGPTP